MIGGQFDAHIEGAYVADLVQQSLVVLLLQLTWRPPGNPIRNHPRCLLRFIRRYDVTCILYLQITQQSF